MAAWQLNETRGLGGGDRVWKLSREGDGLTIGRAAYCDIHVLSQSVERKHSVIKWDQRKDGYIIHDLGSTNGTFLNDLPLSNGVALLRHGDVLRFGYDKGHLFRVKRVERPPSPPGVLYRQPNPSSPPPSTSSSTQTSPHLHQEHHHTPPQPQVQSGGVQFVPMAFPSPSLIVPALQPYFLPQPIYSAHVPHIGHVTTSSALFGYTSPYGSVVPPTPLPSTPLPSTPLPLLPSYPISYTPHPPPSTSSQPHSTTTPTHTQPGVIDTSENRGLKRSNSLRRASNRAEVKPTVSVPPSPPRKDGRRSISLSSSNMPRLSAVSSLYGRPSWWAGDDDEGAPVVTNTRGDSPRKPAKRIEPQILRDISPPPLSPSGSPQGLSHTPRDPSSGGDAGEATGDDTNTSSSWVVEVSPRQSRAALPQRWRKQVRSADSSPIRTPPGSGGKNRSVSPSVARLGSSKSAVAGGRDSTPLSQRARAAKPPSKPATSGSRHRGKPGSSHRERTSSLHTAKSHPTTTTKRKKTEKPPSKQERLTQSPTASKNTAVRETRGSPPPSEPTAPTKPVTAGVSGGEGELGSVSDTTLLTGAGAEGKVTDETFVVKSPTYEDEGRPNSARKTWNNQPHKNSLMLASIETRMRRLDRTVQDTFLSMCALEEGRVPECVAADTPQLAASGESDTHHLPEWKFFDKEVDSIFKSIRSVEKWLKDIDATVGRLQLREVGRQEGKDKDGESELVDFHETSAHTSESEGTEFPDSIEDGDCTGVGSDD